MRFGCVLLQGEPAKSCIGQPGARYGRRQVDAQAAGCESVSVAAGYSFDDSVQAQSAEVVGHSASRG